MAYSIWDNTQPLDSSAANLLGQDIRNVESQVTERMNDLLGITDWTTQLQPMRAKVLRLDHDTVSQIIPGTLSLSLRNNANNTDNLLINDGGSVTIRSTLTITSGGISVSSGGVTVATGGVTVNAGGLVINGGGITVVSLGGASVFNTNTSVVNAQGSIAAFRLGVIATATVLLDWNNGNNQHITVGVATLTLTFQNPVIGALYFLKIKQDGTGNRIVTWPASIHWAGNTTPTLTTSINTSDCFTLYCYDGVNYLGFVAGFNFNV